MDPDWPATQLHLQSIRQEYDAIHQEVTIHYLHEYMHGRV